MRRIVDAHHHLWDLSACHYPWLMARGVKRFFGDPTPIQKNYRVEDLRRDAGEFELAASVHIQVGVAPGDELKETAWLQQTGEQQGLPSAIVAYCDLSQPDSESLLAKQVAFSRVRGVRQIIGRSDEEDEKTGSGDLLNDEQWRANLARLGQLGLSFDLQLIPSQVPRVIDALAGAPQTQIALCHCGSPWDQTTKGVASWREGLCQLAQLPNVACKISGLGMFDHGWTTDSIRPLVESCIEIFGVRRCMFGSNFPVDSLHAGYTRIWRAFESIASQLSESDQRKLFADNALEFYRIS